MFVWLYHGLWCKLLGGCPEHAAIVGALPFLSAAAAQSLLAALGAFETLLAVWVASGRSPYASATVQTLLLAAMNGGGLLFGHAHIAAPAAMIVQNFAFLALVWLVARDAHHDATVVESGTSWSAGHFDAGAGRPALLFGRMYEDWQIEAAAFAPGAHAFCIASAGNTAFALAARGFEVTAVDLNPEQVAYVRARLAGATPRDGHADRLFVFARSLQPWIGWSGVRAFLELEDPAEQLHAWDGRFATARLRFAVRATLRPSLLGILVRADLLRALPESFGDLMLQRLRRGFGRHPNRSNPYAWRLLLGGEPPGGSGDEPPREAARIALACADAASYLESAPARSFSAFSLSNVLDGASPAYGARLAAAVRRAAAPGAMVVHRSFGLPGNVAEAEWAARDRSFLWGSVRVVPATEF